jgi:hypothetical protein
MTIKMRFKKSFWNWLLFVGMSSMSSWASGAEELEASPTILDFGIVPKNASEVQGVVKVRNTGSQDVHIDKIATSCGCTSAHLEKMDIQPGEICDLIVKADFSRGLGSQQTSAVLEFGNPVKDVLVQVKAIVTDVVTVVPPKVIFSNFEENPENRSNYVSLYIKHPFDRWQLSNLLFDSKLIDAKTVDREEQEGLSVYKIKISLPVVDAWGGDNVTYLEVEFKRPVAADGQIDKFSTYLRIERKDSSRVAIIPSILDVGRENDGGGKRFFVFGSNGVDKIQVANTAIFLNFKYEKVADRSGQVVLELSQSEKEMLKAKGALVVWIGDQPIRLPIFVQR